MHNVTGGPGFTLPDEQLRAKDRIAADLEAVLTERVGGEWNVIFDWSGEIDGDEWSREHVFSVNGTLPGGVSVDLNIDDRVGDVRKQVFDGLREIGARLAALPE